MWPWPLYKGIQYVLHNKQSQAAQLIDQQKSKCHLGVVFELCNLFPVRWNAIFFVYSAKCSKSKETKYCKFDQICLTNDNAIFILIQHLDDS